MAKNKKVVKAETKSSAKSKNSVNMAIVAQMKRCHDRAEELLRDPALMEFELQYVRDVGFTLKALFDVRRTKNLTAVREVWDEQGVQELKEVEKIPHTDGLDDGGAYDFYDSIKLKIRDLSN
ncbi:MAG: hypothetical protein COT73_05550 [Bdellovibrio sp. CG10_big_fil_rev_8_21_14_0_10_47_8]|nr:MAG: hypothetical protein COT73_05550 [Bdellovibrio sp. CG10_big_fil_rev_8_21_14_0_10_47_8]